MNSYSQDIDEELVSKLERLAKRDKTSYTALQKKMVQIAYKVFSFSTGFLFMKKKKCKEIFTKETILNYCILFICKYKNKR